MSHLLCIVFLLAVQPGNPGLPPLDPTKTAAKTPSAKTAAATPPKKSETPADESDVTVEEKSFWEWLDRVTKSGAIGFLRKGGFFMWPILIMGVIAIGVMIERYRSLRMVAGDSSKFRNQIRLLLQEDRVQEAMNLCDSREGPVPAILAAGIRKYFLLRKLGYDPAKTEEQVVKRWTTTACTLWPRSKSTCRFWEPSPALRRCSAFWEPSLA